MNNVLLTQQIFKFLGKNPAISPQMSALFEAISETYDKKINQQIQVEKSLVEKEMLVNEYHHNFLQLSNLFEKIAEQMNGAIKLLNEENEVSKLRDEKNKRNLLGLASEINQQIRIRNEKSEANEKRLFELENINKELDQFAYIVSHDLKAPLRAISNLSQWIEDDISELLNEQSKENLKLLRSRICRMESLINAILTYSKSTKGKRETELADTGWLLNEVLDSLNCPKNISITVQGKFPVIQTESIKLQQVFANLISNSIKYNDKQSGHIEIGFFETEEYCQFYVQDNGPGIEPQYQKKVFLIFQTLEVKDEYESTGIGLAIVKKIIEDKGGKIWIESEMGKGTRFVFLWPKFKSEILQKI